MKILFVGSENPKWGSARIHVQNLSKWMKELGHDITLNSENYSEFDIIIAGKEVDLETYRKIRSSSPKSIIGKVNPSDISEQSKEILGLSDFFIVGSLPEKEYYLQYNPNIFMFPQIENIFSKYKTHEDKEEIVVGYHGNLEHLQQFAPYLTAAIEDLSKEIKIKVLAIYDEKSLGTWEHGKPSADVEIRQWTLEAFEENILECDIGILTGLSVIDERLKKELFDKTDIVNPKHGGYANDYLVRYKNNTNAGRGFVFHQVGIPVISDISPTSFHILGNPRNGYIAYHKESWLIALRELAKSASKRQEIADNAKAEFDRLYDPKVWAQNLYDDLNKLHEHSKKTI